jgi:hypothetical protein
VRCQWTTELMLFIDGISFNDDAVEMSGTNKTPRLIFHVGCSDVVTLHLDRYVKEGFSISVVSVFQSFPLFTKVS